MKRTSVLCLALVALVLYMAMNYKSNAQVQGQPAPTTVRATRMDPYSRQGAAVQVSGRIVGFSCVQTEVSGTQCFVATTD